MKELTCLLVCVIMFFIYMNYIRKSIYLSLVKSTVDGNEYYVIKDSINDNSFFGLQNGYAFLKLDGEYRSSIFWYSSILSPG